MDKVKEELIDFTKDRYESPKPDIVILDEKTEKKKDTLKDKKNSSE